MPLKPNFIERGWRVVLPECRRAYASRDWFPEQRRIAIEGNSGSILLLGGVELVPDLNRERIEEEIHGISKQSVRKYLCEYLATQDIRSLAPQERNTERTLTQDEKNMRKALNKYYYTTKKRTLKNVYTFMLKDSYCDGEGKLLNVYPSFYQFRYYFKSHLLNYSVLTVSRKSLHPDDDYLYIVSAKNEKDNTYAVWTCWNESTRSLNHGNYNIKSLEACEKLVKEYIDTTIYFEVYRYSHNVKERIFIADSEEQAKQFCEGHGWELKDENDFLWSLDYREA